jgi:hypothetical protein
LVSLKGRDHLRDLGVDGRIRFWWILRMWVYGLGTREWIRNGSSLTRQFKKVDLLMIRSDIRNPPPPTHTHILSGITCCTFKRNKTRVYRVIIKIYETLSQSALHKYNRTNAQLNK